MWDECRWGGEADEMHGGGGGTVVARCGRDGGTFDEEEIANYNLLAFVSGFDDLTWIKRSGKFAEKVMIRSA